MKFDNIIEIAKTTIKHIEDIINLPQTLSKNIAKEYKDDKEENKESKK